MFNAHNIQKHYGARALLDGVALTLGAGERVGLVGRNGCGKSTLLRILAGVEEADRGHIGGQRGLSVGYLPQLPDFAPGMTVIEAMSEGLPPGVPLWQMRKALFGLGFREAQLAQAAGTLSGGEKTRLMLARLLVGEHDLLLLDEPTNHLDITMLGWLEGYLRGYRGAYLVISHDRRFLDNAVMRILELDEGRLTEYAGNYTAYAEAKQRALERQQEDYVLQQRQIRALREFAARQSGWAEATQGGPKRGRDQRGRIAEKMAKRAHAAERRIEQILDPRGIGDVPKPGKVEKRRDTAHVSARFQVARRSGQIVFEAREVAKAFGPRTLFGGLNATVTYGERIGIVGPNGAGKTTLVRVLLGLEPPSVGEVRPGTGVQPLFLTQEQEHLDPEKTVLETLEGTGGLSHTEARTLLACFLFRENEVFKRVRDLSAGERVRLAVAGAVVSGANLLVLDEPTNHLDIDTRERLEDAIAAYPGTLLVVSHDRYLLDRLADRLLIVDAGRVQDFPGSYTEWAEA
ncbi:MAG TPA: ABC-F family ATP-binding cassette domain-containing protein [Chthonomonadaceae bacterium]|nr:ABC-F family ATP-binding cassette domain-containing protein [Chthonomonadaceae bacterium]